MTNDEIDEIWESVEWKDLCPVMPGFNEALRHRFARAVRVSALADATHMCIAAADRANAAGLQQHADAAASLAVSIAALTKE